MALATSARRTARGGVVALFLFGATRRILPRLCAAQRLVEGLCWTLDAFYSLGVVVGLLLHFIRLV